MEVFNINTKSSVFFCSGTDISATVTPIGLKVCMMVRAMSCKMLNKLNHFWWRYLYWSPNVGSRKGLSWIILVYQIPIDFCHLTANIWKTVGLSRSVIGQLELNISSTRAFFLKMVAGGAPIGPNMLHFCVFFEHHQLSSFIIFNGSR